MRDSFVFYRSFAEACRELDAETFKTVVLAIADYAMNDIEPDITGAPKAVFLMAKPNIDANNQRYENGKRGGRNQNQTETKANQTETKANQTITKPKPNVTKPEPNVDVDVDVDIKETVSKDTAKKKPVKHRHGERVLLTDTEYERLKQDYGEDQTEEAIKYLDAYIVDKGYKSQSHNLALRRWVFDAVEEQKQRRSKLNAPRSGTTVVNAFNSFEQRDYDFDALEKMMLDKQMEG